MAEDRPSGSDRREDIDCEFFLILLNMVFVSLKQAPLELSSKYIEAFEFVPVGFLFQESRRKRFFYLP